MQFNLTTYSDAPDDYEPIWRIENLIQADGLNVIAGAPKTHKTMLRRYLLCCMISGEPAFGRWKIGKKIENGLILVAEDHPGAEKNKMMAILRELGYDGPVPVTFAEPDSFKINNPAHFKELVSLVERDGFDYVSFDPLILFHSVDENSASELSVVLERLHQLKHIATPLIVHHAGKDTPGFQRSVTDTPRGSSAIGGSANCLISLTKRQGRHKIRRAAKSADDRDDWEVMLDFNTWCWKMAKPYNQETLCEEVREHPWESFKDYATRLGKRHEEVLRDLKALVEVGRLQTRQEGKYVRYGPR